MSVPYERILVPLDGSAAAEGAIPHAAWLARTSGAELTLALVASPIAEVIETGAEPIYVDEQWEARRRAALAYLGRVAARAELEGLTVRTAAEIGLPADGILDVASKTGSDVIVMTTHGRSGLKRWLLGSVAEKVVRAASVPVLLVRLAPPLSS